MNQTNKVFYTLVAIFLSCSIEMAGQVQKVISGTVTELFGKTAEPLVGVNVNLVNNQNRSLGGGITNLNGQYNVKVPEGEKDLTIVYSLPFNIGIVLGSSFIVHLEENEKRVLPTVPCFVLITNTPLAP